MRAALSFLERTSGYYFPCGVAENSAVHIAILIVAPLIMLAGNTDWIFNELGLIDPWIYVGYFENYDLPAWLPEEKKIARIPWILGGFATYKLFSPLVASYVIHLFYLVSPPAMTYIILKKYFARWIAFFSAISLLFFIPFHGPHGWDYHGAGSGFYYLLTFWLVSVAATSRAPLVWMALAGAAFGVTLHANIIFVNWTPLLLMQFLILRRNLRLPNVWKLGAAGLSGMTGVTLLFCSINYLVGRPFWFHELLVDRIQTHLREPDGQVWWLPWSSGWFLGWDGVPLVLPTVIFAVACWLVLSRFRRAQRISTPADTIAISLQWQFIVAAIILVVWQILGQTALQPWNMAVPIIFPAFLALGGQLHLSVPGPNYSRTLIYVAVPAAYVFALMACKLFALEMLWALPVPALTNSNAAVVPLVLYSAAFAILCVFEKKVAGFFVFSLLLIFANLIALDTRPSYQSALQSPTERALFRARSQEDLVDNPSDAYGFHEGCSIRKNVFMATIAAIQFLTSQDNDPTNIKLWWDDSEHLGRMEDPKCQLSARHVALPISVTGLSRIANPWPVMPMVNDIPDQTLKAMANETIVVLSNRPDGSQAMIERLNHLNSGPIGARWSATAKKEIRTSLLSFSLTVLRRNNDTPSDTSVTAITDVFPKPDSSTQMRIETPATPWAYGAVLTNTRPELRGPAWVQMEVHIVRGPVGIGILNVERNDFLIRKRFESKESSQVITLPILEHASVGDLVFESWAEGIPAIVVLNKVIVIVPKSQ
jgi:hypothetical protein